MLAASLATREDHNEYMDMNDLQNTANNQKDCIDLKRSVTIWAGLR